MLFWNALPKPWNSAPAAGLCCSYRTGAVPWKYGLQGRCQTQLNLSVFLHKGKEEGDSCWRISRVWDGGTYLPHWPEALVGLLLTRCSGLGCCGESAEACLSFWLSPPAAHPSEHQWYCQGMLSVPRLATRFGKRMECTWTATGFWDKDGACFWVGCVN